ncbi:hypothetical protein GCM10017608_23020 [Agromyces luteolus]|uniref:YfhO family protein n=1 Tax=Agromyces luteolus TaxID=88373 RepID=A0A7C9HKB5_9MICO|nr:YfhO family protein [Agromyces luteolus]MUN07024.1 YfhO family protein [Agromyces luteolus]GLK28368.1 hypothetical protein GCM10017608_23020 [Agromyces luteolus]
MSTATPPHRRRPSSGAPAILTRLASVPWGLVVAWGALVLFTVLSIGLPLVGIGTFLGTQFLAAVPPWQSELADMSPITNRLIGDTIDTIAPQTLLFVDSVRAGSPAGWNPYVAGGAELGGLPNFGVYSPLSLPWWVLPGALAPAFVKLLEIALITLGMSLFLRRLGIRQETWPVASILFAASGFMIAWTNWPQNRVAAFIPLLFWALERAAVEARLRDILPVGVAVAGMMLGGFPAIAGYALYLGGAYVIVRALSMRSGVRAVIRSGLVSAGGVLLGLLLSAWQLVPFAVNALNVIDLSIRRQSPESHLPIEDLASALVPDINGGPTIGSWGGHPVEHLSYASAVALVLLATVALFRRGAARQRGVAIFFAVALGVSVVLVYVGGPLLGMAQELPIFSNNPVGRLRVIVGFSAAILAAIGFDRMLSSDAPGADLRQTWASAGLRGRLALTLRLAVPTLLALGAIGIVLYALRRVPGERLGEVRHQVAAIAITALLAVAMVVLTYFWRRATFRVIAAVVIPIVLVVPATLVASAWWPKSETSTFYPSSPTHEFLDDNLGEGRYASVGQVTLPGSSSLYRQRAVGGHAFMTPQWKDLMLAVDDRALQSPTYSSLPSDRLGEYGRSAVLDRLAVRYLVVDPGVALPGDVDAGTRVGGVRTAGEGSFESGVQRGPVRGVAYTIDEGVASSADGIRLVVEIVDAASGSVLTETSTWIPATSGTRSIAVMGEDLADDAEWFARLTIEGADSEYRVASSADADLAVDVIRPADDGLRIVHTGDATILERQDAAERVHWADDAVVEEDSDARVELLASGSLGAATAVLDEAPSASVDSGSNAAIEVVDSGSTDRQQFRVVVEDGDGLLVVEDSFRRPGWSATVDGEPVEMIAADHVAAAVALDEGQHEVVLSYSPPGLAAGTIATLITLLGLAAGYGAWWFRSRRRSPGQSD